MNLMPNIKRIFNESLDGSNMPPVDSDKCPICKESSAATMRHIGAPNICKNGHYYGGTCGHPKCANTPSPVKEELSTDPSPSGVSGSKGGGNNNPNNNNMQDPMQKLQSDPNKYEEYSRKKVALIKQKDTLDQALKKLDSEYGLGNKI